MCEGTREGGKEKLERKSSNLGEDADEPAFFWLIARENITVPSSLPKSRSITGPISFLHVPKLRSNSLQPPSNDDDLPLLSHPLLPALDLLHLVHTSDSLDYPPSYTILPISTVLRVPNNPLQPQSFRDDSRRRRVGVEEGFGSPEENLHVFKEERELVRREGG